MEPKSTFTINDIVFTTGDRVKTPEGPGVIADIDPFSAFEILVRLTRQNTVRWFSFRDVTIDRETLSA